MSYESFWKLHEKLKDGISLAHKQYLEKMKRQRRARRSCSSVRGRLSLNSPAPPPVPDGKIRSSVRLACALRYFAGGLSYDIMAKYGVSHSEVHTIFMATPYPNTSGGSKDNYNFYHSQLRIWIECAFGMLVKRWGVLRMAMPQGIAVKKTIALVNCVAKLHNFCIDEVDDAIDGLTEDACNVECGAGGFVPTVANNTIRDVLDMNVQTPEALVGGGDHFDDVPRALGRSRTVASSELILPRTKLCKHVEDMHMVRPTSNRRY
jgi:hypothetical protein